MGSNTNTEPQRFQQRPEPFDAMQWDGTAEGATPIINWILSKGGTARYVCSDPDRCAEHNGDCPHWIEINSPGGPRRVNLHSWVIRHPHPGTDFCEFYPCGDATFRDRYEPVPTIREEWRVTGEPSQSTNADGVKYPSYRFDFGNPNDITRNEGTPEERARGFVAMIRKHDPTGWGGTMRMWSRVITESPWKDEQL